MNIVSEIIKVLDEKLKWNKCAKFYIGKTDDFERRELEHQNQNDYTFCWELAKGKPEKIGELENELIEHYKQSEYSTILENENSGSGGNNNAETLYVAFRFCQIKQMNDLSEDMLQVKKGFPITL